MIHVLYTDGSCLKNPGRGGYGVLVDYKTELSGGYGHTTNQRAEVLAAIVGLNALEPSTVRVVSDSQYLVKTMEAGWKRKANQDLWARLDAAVARHERVRFTWVRGHAGDLGNEAADRLATEAARSGPWERDL